MTETSQVTVSQTLLIIKNLARRRPTSPSHPSNFVFVFVFVFIFVFVFFFVYACIFVYHRSPPHQKPGKATSPSHPSKQRPRSQARASSHRSITTCGSKSTWMFRNEVLVVVGNGEWGWLAGLPAGGPKFTCRGVQRFTCRGVQSS